RDRRTARRPGVPRAAQGRRRPSRRRTPRPRPRAGRPGRRRAGRRGTRRRHRRHPRPRPLGTRPRPRLRAVRPAPEAERPGRGGPAMALLEECRAEVTRRPEADPATLVLYSIYLSHAYGDAGDYGRAAAALADALRGDVEEIDRRVRAFAYHALARLYCTTG